MKWVLCWDGVTAGFLFTCGNPICSSECMWYFTLGAEDFRAGCVTAPIFHRTHRLENMSMIVFQRRSPGLQSVRRSSNNYHESVPRWGSSLSLSLPPSLSLSFYISQIAGYQAEFLAIGFLLIRRLLLSPNWLFFHSICVSCYLEPQLSHLRMY